VRGVLGGASGGACPGPWQGWSVSRRAVCRDLVSWTDTSEPVLAGSQCLAPFRAGACRRAAPAKGQRTSGLHREAPPGRQGHLPGALPRPCRPGAQQDLHTKGRRRALRRRGRACQESRRLGRPNVGTHHLRRLARAVVGHDYESPGVDSGQGCSLAAGARGPQVRQDAAGCDPADPGPRLGG
jgi:hypothetical protein